MMPKLTNKMLVNSSFAGPKRRTPSLLEDLFGLKLYKWQDRFCDAVYIARDLWARGINSIPLSEKSQLLIEHSNVPYAGRFYEQITIKIVEPKKEQKTVLDYNDNNFIEPHKWCYQSGNWEQILKDTLKKL